MNGMHPEQFTMWLRGVLDATGEGKAIPVEVSRQVYEKLTEVVAGQVADRFRATYPVDPPGVPYDPYGNVHTGTPIPPRSVGHLGGAVAATPLGESYAKKVAAMKMAEIKMDMDNEIRKMVINK